MQKQNKEQQLLHHYKKQWRCGLMQKQNKEQPYKPAVVSGSSCGLMQKQNKEQHQLVHRMVFQSCGLMQKQNKVLFRRDWRKLRQKWQRSKEIYRTSPKRSMKWLQSAVNQAVCGVIRSWNYARKSKICCFRAEFFGTRKMRIIEPLTAIKHSL